MAAPDRLTLLDDLIARARRAGADAADVVAVDSQALSVSHRMGRSENIERAEATDLGLRVIIGKRQAVVSSTDLSTAGLERLPEIAMDMARAAPDDPWCGLADPAMLAQNIVDLDITEDAEPTAEALQNMAAAGEDAARAVSGVTNSEGAEAGWSRSHIVLATSGGFRGGYVTSHYGFSVSVLAGT
jgi:PmbA protein